MALASSEDMEGSVLSKVGSQGLLALQAWINAKRTASNIVVQEQNIPAVEDVQMVQPVAPKIIIPEPEQESIPVEKETETEIIKEDASVVEGQQNKIEDIEMSG